MLRIRNVTLSYSLTKNRLPAISHNLSDHEIFDARKLANQISSATMYFRSQ